MFANAFSLDQSKILLFGKELNGLCTQTFKENVRKIGTNIPSFCKMLSGRCVLNGLDIAFNPQAAEGNPWHFLPV